MRLWLDDVRPAPEGYDVVCFAVNNAIATIKQLEHFNETIELIDVDHDLGEYAKFGGDGVKLLDWLEETGRNYPIRIHSANVVGRENMLRICRKNNWTILN